MRIDRRVVVRFAAIAIAAVVAALISQYEASQARPGAGAAIEWSPALDEQWVDTAVTIYRVLPDDNEGSRHQRMLGRTAEGHSLLIVHNIDLAPRVPAREGDRLEVRGQFEWNDKGGLVHWTHHDPKGRHAGGYIDFGGRRYR